MEGQHKVLHLNRFGWVWEEGESCPGDGYDGEGHGVNIVRKWDASFIYVALASG